MSMEEFALCWNNYTDNIITAFSSLLLHGNLCDVTLAVDGQLLKAHKVVLSICSPYFQRVFIDNPCQHPVIILKDMDAKLIKHLLEFMYQGSVNVKQAELKAFMKIAENLQIKGLTTNTKKPKTDDGSAEADKDKSDAKNGTKRSLDSSPSSSKAKSQKMEGDEDVTDLTNDDECEAQSHEDLLMTVPEISMIESRSSDINNANKSTKESNDLLRITSHQPTLNLFSPYEYSAEALLAEVQAKSGTPSENSLNSPSGSNITMLSSTSLLHGNCIFNRNNTVATQQGLKTYWLCKSYRISMCKARCITHQGKVISATGVHNHLPHMNNQKEQLPPGHTQNLLCNPPVNEFNTNHSMTAAASTSSQQHPSHNPSVSAQHLMLSQPYHYSLHGMHDAHSEHMQRSLQLPNIHHLGNSHDGKLAFNSSDGNNFKLEHI